MFRLLAQKGPECLQCAVCAVLWDGSDEAVPVQTSQQASQAQGQSIHVWTLRLPWKERGSLSHHSCNVAAHPRITLSEDGFQTLLDYRCVLCKAWLSIVWPSDSVFNPLRIVCRGEIALSIGLQCGHVRNTDSRTLPILDLSQRRAGTGSLSEIHTETALCGYLVHT